MCAVSGRYCGSQLTDQNAFGEVSDSQEWQSFRKPGESPESRHTDSSFHRLCWSVSICPRLPPDLVDFGQHASPPVRGHHLPKKTNWQT